MSHTEKYDRIGYQYNQTRQADPYITTQLMRLLLPVSGAFYADIGCGTGNYTIALHKLNVPIIGIEPSSFMLNKAQEAEPEMDWRQGWSHDIPMASNYLNGAIATLTIHHWENLAASFKEIYRVMKSGGRLVIFTSCPTQMKGYWLNAYFPQMLKDSIIQMPAYEKVVDLLIKAGFEQIERKNYFVSPHLQDLFLYSGKHRPHLYLDPAVRSGISSFADLSLKEEVDSGLASLDQDIKNGYIKEVMERFENERGDYLFVAAIKKP